MKPGMINKYDKDGYVSFGKHTGTKFESVPDDYLRYCIAEVDLDKLKQSRLNFYKYLMDHYAYLMQDEF